MATPIFPTDLPIVSRFSIQPVETVLSDKDAGKKDFRRRSESAAAIADVEWIFVNSDYSIYEDFRKKNLLGAHKWFYIKLPSAGGITWHIARFTTKPESSVIGHSSWRVSGQLSILARQLDEQSDPQTYPDLLGFTFKFKSALGGG